MAMNTGTPFNKGDKVRYKKFPVHSGYNDWNGIEGEVIWSDNYTTRVTVTKEGVSDRGGKLNQVTSLTTANLELTPEVRPSVGDKVRVKHTHDTAEEWTGVEGLIETAPVYGDTYQMKITKANPGIYFREGDTINIPLRKLEVIESADAEQELPREVDLAEIRVGDTVRVTYPTQTAGRTVEGSVTEESTTVRTARVEKVNGREILSGSGHLINARLNGLSEAVYTLLERDPEPKANPVAGKAVGASFLTSEGPVGKRLLTKIGDNMWTDFFLTSCRMYPADDRMALEAFEERNGKWVKL